MDRVRKIFEKINTKAAFQGEFRFNEPMSAHCTFKTGGPADLWLRPDKESFVETAGLTIKIAREEEIPLFFLGAGANILVSDLGIRGIVLDTSAWEGLDVLGQDKVKVLSGTPMDSFLETLAQNNLGGYEHFGGLPASVGGALWMNARCYERSFSERLIETAYLDETGEPRILPYNEGDFAYKHSPFQDMGALILWAIMGAVEVDQEESMAQIRAHRRDREEKGQFRYPSAGSVFKNNPAFGESTGQIIDKLGLKGLQFGSAQVAPWHGNFIINLGDAYSQDIKDLIEIIIQRVRDERGFEIEREVLLVGEWALPE